MKEVIIILLLSGGIFFFAVGALGLIRLPDVFTRMHAVTKSDTLGAGLLLLSLIVYYGWETASLHLGAIIIFIAISTPVAAHLVARAVYKSEKKTRTNADADADADTDSDKSGVENKETP